NRGSSQAEGARMKRYGRCLLVGLVLVAGVWLAAGRGQAQGDKGEPWQPILPKDVYKELVKREADIIQEILNEKDVSEARLQRATFGAVLIAALTQSVQDGNADEVRGTFEAAWRLQEALHKKGGLDEARKIAGTVLTAKADPQKKL